MAFVPPAVASAERPGADPLSIGPFTFNSVECPEKPPIGGVEDKAPAIELIGGGRVVHSVGAQPQDIEWSGRFLQPNAWQKIAALRAMAVSGQEYLLTWAGEQWYGKIVKIIPKPRHANYIEYDLVFRVTRDGNGALTVTAPTSVDAQVSALTANAQSQNTAVTSLDPTGSAAYQQPFNTLLATLAAAGPIAQLSGTALAGVTASIETALEALDSYASTVPETSPQYVAAQQLLTSISLISTFVAQGQSQSTITVQGTDLFDVASQVYGDPALAFALASANGLPSPFTTVAEPTTLVLPPFQAQAA